jgi:hypothetical protein
VFELDRGPYPYLEDVNEGILRRTGGSMTIKEFRELVKPIASSSG